MQPPMKPMMTRMPDVNTIGSETNGVDVSANPSPYRISHRPSIKSPAGCTLLGPNHFWKLINPFALLLIK
jgi:hypothetical protein